MALTYSQQISELARLNRLSASRNSPEQIKARNEERLAAQEQKKQLDRLLQVQGGTGALNTPQDKYSRQGAGILGLVGGGGPSAPVTAHKAGQALGDGSGRVWDGMQWVQKHLYNATASAAESVGNFGRGALGMPEDNEQGFRYQFNGQQPANTQNAGALSPPQDTQQVAPQGTPPVLDQPIEEQAPLVPGQEGYVAPVEEGVPMSPQEQYQTRALAAAQQQSPRISLGEAMGRYGGAIMNSGSQGGMAQVGAMGSTTGEIGDKNRELEQQQYDNDLARDKAAQAAQAAQAKNTAESFGSPADIYAAEDTANKISDLRGLLSNPDLNVVGATKWSFFNAIGSAFGTDEASIRLRLQELVVDKTLSNTAFTKGAISDKEMKLFRSDIPEFTSDESVWLKWLEDYEAASRMMAHNLRTGYAPYKAQNSKGYASGSTLSAEDEDAFNNL